MEEWFNRNQQAGNRLTILPHYAPNDVMKIAHLRNYI